MAYSPIHDYRAKDGMPAGATGKRIKGADLSDEFEAISTELAPRVVASLKWNGTTSIYSNNIASVHNMVGTFPDGQDMTSGWGQCRVYFENLIPEFDLHYAASIQPFATPQANSHVIATINWMAEDFVQWAWGYLILNGDKFVKPPAPPAFSLIIVDADQGEAS